MKITKIRIKSLFGIKEVEITGKDCEIQGENGVGKTSIIDAIKFALSNKSDREIIIHSESKEGYVYIETDVGLTFERHKRRDKVDTVKINDNGKAVDKTKEAFLRELFAPLQLNPVEFLQMDTKEQNRIILDLIDFKWDLNWIKEQFGELPEVNYEQNILRVLNEIQSEDGYYFLKRQDINRDIRNKKAIIEEIGSSLPPEYNAAKWRKMNLSELYTKIEKIRATNREIDKAQGVVKTFADKIRSFEADKEIAIGAVEKETSNRRESIEKSMIKLKDEIRAFETEMKTLEDGKINKIALKKEAFKANVAEFEVTLGKARPLAEKELTSISGLEEEAKSVEDMKSHVNEYERMVRLQGENKDLQGKAEGLTVKIEKARTLPGEILEISKIPVKDLTIVDGEPRIKGLPVSNLSDGEKLRLCISIARENKNSLNLILIDGVEKLSKNNREDLYKECKAKGVQFIATRTTDDNELIVTEL